MTPIEYTAVWATEADTKKAAQQLAACPSICNAHINLHGDLGAGKTTFVRHLLGALGVQGRIKSPTYAIIEPHEGEFEGTCLPISHFDFYRFDDPREWEEAGFRDAFAGAGLKLVEWPQRAEDCLPAADLALHLSWPADGTEWRQAAWQALSPIGAHLLESMAAAR